MGERPVDRSDDPHASGERGDVRLRDDRAPHPRVHRRRQQKRPVVLEAGRRERSSASPCASLATRVRRAARRPQHRSPARDARGESRPAGPRGHVGGSTRQRREGVRARRTASPDQSENGRNPRRSSARTAAAPRGRPLVRGDVPPVTPSKHPATASDSGASVDLDELLGTLAVTILPSADLPRGRSRAACCGDRTPRAAARTRLAPSPSWL